MAKYGSRVVLSYGAKFTKIVHWTLIFTKPMTTDLTHFASCRRFCKFVWCKQFATVKKYQKSWLSVRHVGKCWSGWPVPNCGHGRERQQNASFQCVWFLQLRYHYHFASSIIFMSLIWNRLGFHVLCVLRLCWPVILLSVFCVSKHSKWECHFRHKKHSITSQIKWSPSKCAFVSFK